MFLLRKHLQVVVLPPKVILEKKAVVSKYHIQVFNREREREKMMRGRLLK